MGWSVGNALLSPCRPWGWRRASKSSAEEGGNGNDLGFTHPYRWSRWGTSPREALVSGTICLQGQKNRVRCSTEDWVPMLACPCS